MENTSSYFKSSLYCTQDLVLIDNFLQFYYDPGTGHKSGIV